MSFTTTRDIPATNAGVTVKFAGLMLLKPNENNGGCDIGIHRLSETHALQVIVVVSKPDRPPSLIRLVTGTLTQPFAINVTPDPGTGVQVFARGADPFDRTKNNNELDFRWAINMQQLHQDADFNGGARPVATLNAGTLYTSNLTPVELTPELVNGVTRTPLPRFSADLAAAIDLSNATTVELSWNLDSGERRTLRLPRPNDPPRTTYTVTLLNDPPAPITSIFSHDELAHYYEVLEVNGQPIPGTNQYRISYNGSPTTDEIPCMPVVLNPPRT